VLPPPTRGGGAGRPRGSTAALNVAAAAIILLSAAALYLQFLPAAHSLWDSPYHDRSGHYSRSLAMAVALRHGNLAALVTEVHADDVWPPLHPLLTGTILAVGGLDYRLAVLSSLAAWVATCWFVFALAARLVPRYRGLAGCVALVFALASPAYRAYATDIMIESLGAALTLGALYFYVTARQEQSAWRGCCFALLLMALFLTKYNYWALLVAGLVAGALGSVVPWLRAALRQRLTRTGVRAWLAAQVRHPLTYPLLAAFALAFRVQFGGPVSLRLAGRAVTVGSLAFPAELCFVLLLARVGPWWWRTGRVMAAELPIPARQLVHWHLYPLALWFLWPRRLSVFIWYVTCTHHGRAGDSSPWLGSLPYYWQCLGQDYHANWLSLLLVLGLIGLALLCRRGWRTGGGAVFVFIAVAALMTNYHSANRSRFLHSWLAGAWVAAGAGAALATQQLVARMRSSRGAGPSSAALRLLPAGLLAAGVVGLALIQGSALTDLGHAEEGGPKPERPDLLGLADAVVPELVRAEHPALAASAPFEILLDWRLGEGRGTLRRLLVPPRELLAPVPGEELDAWLGLHGCDALLLIDAPFPAVMPSDPALRVERLHEFLASSGRFTLCREWHSADELHITAQVWRRTTAVGGPAFAAREPGTRNRPR
jgi:hypothetical protein